MHNNLLIQGIAILALLAFAGSFQSKTRKSILLWHMMSFIFWILHYFLLSAWTGVLLIAANAIITAFFMFKQKRSWANSNYILYAAIIALMLLTAFTWQGFYSVFAFLGVTSITVAKWQNHVQQIRFIAIFASIFWIVYDIWVGSWGGVITESIIIISIIVSLIRSQNKNPS